MARAPMVRREELIPSCMRGEFRYDSHMGHGDDSLAFSRSLLTLLTVHATVRHDHAADGCRRRPPGRRLAFGIPVATYRSSVGTMPPCFRRRTVVRGAHVRATSGLRRQRPTECHQADPHRSHDRFVGRFRRSAIRRGAQPQPRHGEREARSPVDSTPPRRRGVPREDSGEPAGQ